MTVQLDSIYVPSEDIVARLIEGELIIVPLASGIGDLEDELYTLNETGREVWNRMDGQRSLRSLVQELEEEYEADPGEIEHNVLGLVAELLERRILVEVTRG